MAQNCVRFFRLQKKSKLSLHCYLFITLVIALDASSCKRKRKNNSSRMQFRGNFGGYFDCADFEI
jgi:hypothetical protein